MSSKSKSGLFSRKKNRDAGSDPQGEPNHEPSPEPTPKSPRSPSKIATLPTTDSNFHHSFRGADAINAIGAKHIENLRNKTRDGVGDDLKNDIGAISPELVGFLTPAKKDGPPGKGGHFLDDDIQRFHDDFVDKWKHEMLFPSIQQWLQTHIVGYVENLLRKRTDAIISKYEEAMTAIEERHKQEIIDLERRHKELLTTVVKKTWAEYEKKMEETRFMRQVHFEFAPSAQHEPWSEGVEEIIPDLKDHVPKVYNPKISLDEPQHQNHTNGDRNHLAPKGVNDAATPEDHDQDEGMHRFLD